ncbi:MAG: hypothetical protein ACPL4E_09495 [Thermoproteota archaeon]
MTERIFKIRRPEDALLEVEKEFKELGNIRPIIGVQYMLHKGLKYIPTIIMMACDAEVGSYGDTKMEVSREHEELVLKLFLELEGKVNVRMEKIIGDGTEGAVWPCEILDMKEVRDEAMLLATSDEILLSTDTIRDYWIMRRNIEVEIHRSLTRREKKKLQPEEIRREMEIVNNYLRKWGNFFLKAMEIHRKYPDVRFWFYVTGE